MLEIEAKIKVSSIEPVKEILKEKKAEFLGISIQKDTYYNAPHRDFAETDEALRIRDNGAGFELTYKGAKLRGTDAKAREEFNLDIGSAKEMEKILLRLGFRKTSIVSKKREDYSYRKTTIALDNVEDLGEFIEIEIISDDKDSALKQIDSVKTELGICGKNIPQSYLEMLLEKNNS